MRRLVQFFNILQSILHEHPQIFSTESLMAGTSPGMHLPEAPSKPLVQLLAFLTLRNKRKSGEVKMIGLLRQYCNIVLRQELTNAPGCITVAQHPDSGDQFSYPDNPFPQSFQNLHIVCSDNGLFLR